MEFSMIKDAFDRVSKKQKLSSSKAKEVIDQVGHEVETALEKVQHAADDMAYFLDHMPILRELSAKLKELHPLEQLEESQKELNVALSKYAKLIDKLFVADLSKAYRHVEFDTNLVNQVVVSHLYRQGLFDLGDSFSKEANELDVVGQRLPFLELYNMLEAMKCRDLGPALDWAVRNHERLLQVSSDIELKLHQLQFVEILQKGTRHDALCYAKSHLAPFAPSHLAEFQKLMGGLLWVGRLDQSPYRELLSPVQWEKMSQEVIQHFCKLLGQSYKSPLSVVIAAGVQALPTLMKLVNVMTAKKQEWQSMKQLPVPVDLGSEFQFHSVFVCPVSRDQGSEENPPMLLPCGHVLCKQSIVKLSKSSNRTFKCPYCPQEATVAQCRQLYF